MVTLAQREPFATASVQLGRRLAEESIAPPHRLGAFPPEVYAEMEMRRPGLPPVTGQFTYRPATNPDGTSPQPGWDLVWISPRSGQYSGHEQTAKILDCWYPASYTRAVCEHLGRAQPPSAESARGNEPARSPRRVHLARRGLRRSQRFAAGEPSEILGRRIPVRTAKIWSDRGDLLVDAQIVRRQERPQVARSAERRP